MFCPNCGTDNPSDSLFCVNCGSKLEAAGAPAIEEPVSEVTEQVYTAVEPEAEEASKPVKRKKIVPVIIGIVAAAIVIALGVLLVIGVIPLPSGGSSAGSGSKRVSVKLVRIQKDKVQLFYDGKATDIVIKDVSEYSMSRGMHSNNVVAYITDEDDESVSYYVTPNSIEQLGKDLTNLIISQNGDYITALDDGDLYYGKASEGITKIDKNVSQGNLILSPDGKTVLYTKDENLYIYANGETTKIGKGMEPLTVTNGAKLIYALKYDGTLVCINDKGETTKIAKNLRGVRYTNKDNSQLIFSDDSETLYITDKGGEKIKLAKDCDGFEPVNYAGTYMNGGFTGRVPILDYDSLLDHLYTVSGSLVKLTKNYEFEKITKCDIVQVAKNGTVAYLNNNKLYISDLKGNSEKIASKVVRFELSADGKSIFYVNEDSEIYLYKSAKETVELGEDFGGNVVALSGGGFIFTHDRSNKTSLSDLAYTKDGKDIVKIDEDVSSISYDGGLYAYVKPDDDESEVYGSKDGVKWEYLYTIEH